MREDLAEIFFQSFLWEAVASNSGMGRDVHSLMLAIQHYFPLPTAISHRLQGALKDGSGEAVVTCDMPEPCEFPPLDSCQKRFMSAHNDVSSHPVSGETWRSVLRNLD